MGNLFRIIGLLLVSFLISLGLLAQEKSGEAVKKSENKRHLKIVKIVDGKKVELDTVLINDEPFVWMGDTIKGGSAVKLSRIGKEIKPGTTKSESVYEYRISGDKGGKKMVIVSSDNKEPVIVEEFAGKGDSVKKIILRRGAGKTGSGKIVTWENEKGETFDIQVPPPPAPPVPPSPATFGIIRRGGSNVIDLSDPGIISYRKKKLKDGTEKIEIIRKEVKESESAAIRTGVMIAPQVGRKIEVIREGDSTGDVKVEKIVKEGKVIQIEEIEKSEGGKDVKVDIKVEKEKPAPAEKKK